MAEAAPGRFTFGLGTSSDVIVTPLERHRVRRALQAGPGHHPLPASAPWPARRSTRAYDTFTVRGFRLARPVEHPPPIFLAALRPGDAPAGRTGGRRGDHQLAVGRGRGDGRPRARGGHPGGGPDLRLPDRGRRDGPGHRPPDDRRLPQRRRLRRIPPVAGRGPELEPMWAAGRRGTAKGALAAIPDEVVDALRGPRIVRRVPGAHRPVRGQRRRHPGDGRDPASGVVLGRPRWPRAWHRPWPRWPTPSELAASAAAQSVR